MINHLRGTIHKLDMGEVAVDVNGAGYRVAVPVDVWENLQEGDAVMLWTSTYVREDRFELYGFNDRAGRTLFEEFIALAGVGPKMALELCAVPRSMLLQAANMDDPAILQNVKGIGKKTAEKLVIELKGLLEKKPDILGSDTGSIARHEFDQDAITTLSSLGYDTTSILRTLKDLPPDLKTTEERVEAALRAM